MAEEQIPKEVADLEELARRMQAAGENPEQEADDFAKKMEIPVSGKNAEKTRGVVVSFVQSYKRKEPETANVDWLEKEFFKYPKVWKDDGEAKGAAQVIVETVERYEAERLKLAECKAKGISQESYLANAIEEGAKAAAKAAGKKGGLSDVGQYAAEIDKAIGKANADNAGAMYGMDGGENPQRDSRNADTLDEAQQAQQYEWNDVNRKAIAKNIRQKTGIAALCTVGFQGSRIVGRRIWNNLTGKENKTAEEDAQEFAEKAIMSGASAGLTIATSGGITVAAKSGWLGDKLKKTPVGNIAKAACLGIDNAKTLYKFATGEISGEEAVDEAGSAACSAVGSLAGGGAGVKIGAAMGSVFGPVGTAIGGVVGGLVGGMAGGKVGEAVWEGGKAIVKTAVSAVKTVASAAWEGIKSVGSAIGNFVSGLFSWW
ncbi:MAG: hypothetical protein FWG66_10155 [Spirochaetes bacterium]|nr:hypothetical protein [Spirochaetota bacterium]